MPRRSFLNRYVRVAPPDEETASRYFLYWDTKDLYHTPGAFPAVTSQALFGNDAQLEIEVGCGTGEYLCSLATRNPTVNFTGFDINLKALYVAVEHARSLSLNNVKFVKAPFQYVYPLLADDSVQVIYLHFPEPILHPRFRKQRIYNSALIGHVHRALMPGGKFSIVTDSAELFNELSSLIEGDGRFQEGNLQPTAEPSIKSRYHAYWEAHGVPIHRLEVTKRIS
ncbi:MAG TPA: methyltransferase domain-containing protein [Chloroflexia bacterium]|nr:methyltransferase domain-containing protein [Chloroflexia bacterium]